MFKAIALFIRLAMQEMLVNGSADARVHLLGIGGKTFPVSTRSARNVHDIFSRPKLGSNLLYRRTRLHEFVGENQPAIIQSPEISVLPLIAAVRP